MSHFLPQFNFIRPHATLLMTGSHTLAELRDAICCVSDLQVCGEFSNNPDAAPAFISKVSESGAFTARLKMSHLRSVNGVLSNFFCFRITSSRPSFTLKGCFIMTWGSRSVWILAGQLSLNFESKWLRNHISPKIDYCSLRLIQLV